ncbi:MAG: DUF86 domain-containing protein [Spirochaetales bacterium]|nr:DUF86 domain-containing protein [Leptospiraceae bacterium]MCP5483502.1 DUF86 domain-containing protein [Spirochaetales bacterium]MCP5486746.1 DUF86 domain-containing protein [Spirochaetales bacterium]
MSEKMLQKIGRLRETLELLRGLSSDCRDRIRSDALYRGALLHYLYVLADGVVSLAEMLIGERGLRPPQTYREAIVRLGEAGILEPAFASDFSRIAGFRNFVAHNYDTLDEEIVCGLLERLHEAEEFITAVESALSAD